MWRWWPINVYSHEQERTSNVHTAIKFDNVFSSEVVALFIILLKKIRPNETQRYKSYINKSWRHQLLSNIKGRFGTRPVILRKLVLGDVGCRCVDPQQPAAPMDSDATQFCEPGTTAFIHQFLQIQLKKIHPIISKTGVYVRVAGLILG